MRRHLAFILILVLAGALLFEIIRLFQLRFDSGDVYPAYSSLRSDPLGTMALFESFEAVPGLEVERDLRATNEMPPAEGLTYLHLATFWGAWMEMEEETFREIETFIKSGGRLVVSFYPQASPPEEPRFPRRDREADKEKGEKSEEKGKKKLTARELWGMNVEVRDLEVDGDNFVPAIVEHAGGLPLPMTLNWHSGIVLTSLDPAWNPIYTRGTSPVVMERTFGEGTVVIATDSYFLSNEALLKDRQPQVLSWLIGPNRKVMFDEAHFGITETPGVASLIRRYRLIWVVVALLVVAGLYVWKSSTSLMPKPVTMDSETHMEGRDSAAGFVNLLRRSIPVNQILAVCFESWRKSATQGTLSAARIEAAEAAFQTENSLPKKDRDSVRGYKTISDILRIKTR